MIGFHGGLGGKQTEPFLMIPAGFPLDDAPIVGAAAVHHLFKHWRERVATGALPPPWTTGTA